MRMIKVKACSKDGSIEFEGVTLPSRRIVCTECNGDGTVLREGLRGVAFSSDEMDQDPEFREGYFSGAYDFKCPECKGERVLDAVDDELCRKKISWWKGLIRHKNAKQIEFDAALEYRYERRAEGFYL